MHTFFYGWRRKVGGVMLVVACVLTTAWVRSFVVWDWITFYPRSDLSVQLKSDRGRFGVALRPCEDWEPLSVDWISDTHKPHFGLFAYIDNQSMPNAFPWRWDWIGFSSGEYSPDYSPVVAPIFAPSTYLVVPFWFLVIPSMLLSAFLTLVPSRKRPQPRASLVREFFRGWRRKAGVATLLLALVLIGGWIRSFRIFDEINCTLGYKWAIAIASWKEAFAVRVGWDNKDPWEEFVWVAYDGDYLGYTDPNSESYRFEQPIPDGSGCIASSYLMGYGGGIGVNAPDRHTHRSMAFAVAPYWSVTLLLTLLSAALILRKPLKRT